MSTKTIIYELKMLFRSGWLLLLTFIMLFLIGFASYNGYNKVKKRTVNTLKEVQEIANDDAQILGQINKIEQGVDLGLSSWKSPINPSTIGYKHPRLVVMDAQSLAFIATGQSDMYIHTLKPTILGDLFALDYTEITNPVQLLFGTFDVSFVFVFIIPLLIIAFTFNVLSKEKELGTLRLIGSQPVSIRKWLIHKMAIRFVVFTIISIGIFTISVIFFSDGIFNNLSMLIMTLIILVSYQLFWFVVSVIVNLKINNSSKNALFLIGFWLVITLIIPAIATQISISVYPTPSRLKMVNEIRETKKSIEGKQNEIMADFLRDHPELSSESTGESKFGFWHNYFASQDLLTNELKPLIDKHEKSLRQQQGVVNYFKYGSPSLIVNDAMSKLAGTSTDDYQNFKNQTYAFAIKWREHIEPLLFKGENYSAEIHRKRPVFKFVPLKLNLLGNIITLLILSILVVIISFLVKSKSYFN